MSSTIRAMPRFSDAQCAQLLKAVAQHDVVDLSAELPARLAIDYPPGLLANCYWLSLQLWRGSNRRVLARLAARIASGRSLDAVGARDFRDIRARAKQLRFAYAMVGAGHIYPPRLNRVTRLMGQIQDALRAGRRLRAARRGVSLWLNVTRGGWSEIIRECEGLRATDAPTWRAYLRGEFETIRGTLAIPEITSRAFHDTRKIISRLVAFYDTLTVLAPSAHHDAIDRYLGTINGLMGALHDDMALKKAKSRRDYERMPAPLPDQVAERLRILVAAAAELDQADPATPRA